MNPESLFSLSDHLERLSKDGDPLEVLEATVDFEYFRGWLVEGLGRVDKLDSQIRFGLIQGSFCGGYRGAFVDGGRRMGVF